MNADSAAGPEESSGPTAGLPMPGTASADAPTVGRQESTAGFHYGYYALDINSGDVRGVDGIRESELSKGVRRLGIAVPDQRKWKPCVASDGIGHSQIVC